MSDYEKNEMNERELEWDDDLEYTAGGFVDIPDGEYTFMVDHFERQKVGGDGKYAGQNMAVVFCNILSDAGEPQIRTNLILNTKFKWKLTQFFESIGMIKKDETLKMNWNETAGKRGRCKVEHKENYNDSTKTHLEITEFLPPKEEGRKWGGGEF